MAVTVVFIHGTGVRGERYLAQFERVRDNILQRVPDASVLPCSWGDRLGAALNAGGASVPGDEAPLRARRGTSPELDAEHAWATTQWGLLDADPCHELRMIATVAQYDAGRFVVGAEPFGPRLSSLSQQLASTPPVSLELASLGLLEHFDDAVLAVIGSAAAQTALRTGTEADVAPALGRAYIAEVLRRAAGGPRGGVPVIAERREELVRLIVEQLGSAGLGAGSAVARAGSMLAWRLAGARAVERRRRAVTDAAHPMAGDIMLYLSRGERIRQFIRECCREARPPVVLLAHSLGGIACLDLLATGEVPGVEHLVTVGSQGPLLYELGALPSLAYGEPLPDHMPAWTNFYDPRDLLAYVGAPVFPDRVVDVPVAGGNPFPFAHSDYFGNPAFYDRLREVLT